MRQSQSPLAFAFGYCQGSLQVVANPCRDLHLPVVISELLS